LRNIAGRAINPMAITEADTNPVIAAIVPPTSTTV
jgi:hypothetical protein